MTHKTVPADASVPMTNSTTAVSVLDIATLERLRQLEAFKPGIMAKLVDSFTSNQSRFVRSAQGLAEEGDFENLRIRAHALKGSAASLGALTLAGVAQLIEHNASDQPEVAIAALPELRFEFTRACEALAALVAPVDSD